ncbi:S8 family serine peptidase [Spirulina sp. CS-785/01]|uniref:S8 family serine peptidase n=1 Tax=Spirulina sp. CS-785/01 TaxID=3021716 RepID=UPI00232BEA26|nr:S8 family serine peptidase [Spirulina sp. CS-785/01]MDB9311896.1 S8 family serine peptidase [Spirulina sp. CS-785/01]
MFKRKKDQTHKQNQLQSFILEPILTPSGLVDVDDFSGTDIVDLPPDLEDWQTDEQQKLNFPIRRELQTPDLEDVQTDEQPLPSGEAAEEGEVFSQNLAWAEQGLEPADLPSDILKYDAGVFTVGESGEVGIDFLFDGGKFKGEVAIFSLEGMDEFEAGSEEFIQEAAFRATSDSEFGHIVISDRTEGAKFAGSLGESKDWNSGDYQGVKTVSMRPGDSFGVMLVPNGTVQEVLNDPNIGGSKAPLFSLGTANPDDTLHFGQIADVTGDGNTFVMEDVQAGHKWYDEDYNDLIFQVRGAEGEAPSMDELIEQGVMDAEDDWREGDLGQAVVSYAEQYVDDTASEKTIPDVEQSKQPLVGVIDTGLSSDNPDLDYDKITLGKDRVDGDDNPLLSDGEGNKHGTHVLGVIAAEQDNGIGIDGVNDDAPLWVGRAVGSGQWAESLVEFVDAARESEQPNAVVNLSMDLTQIDAEGNVTTRYEFTPMEMAALEYARQNNVVVSVAAGNDGAVMSALGQASERFDNIITVGAAEQIEGETFDRADYSSYGEGLDIVAKGGTLDNPVLSTFGDDVEGMHGTSVATAQVTGAISQVWAANPTLHYRQVIEILKDTAMDLNAPGFDVETGAGLLNMAAAVQLAKSMQEEEYDKQLQYVPLTWSGEGKVTPMERAATPNYSGYSFTTSSPSWSSFLGIFGNPTSSGFVKLLQQVFDKFYKNSTETFDSKKPIFQIFDGSFGTNTGLVFYDQDSGTGEMYATKNNTSLSILQRDKGWRKTWDKIIPGNFGGDGKSDLLFYERETGNYYFYTVKDNSKMQLLTQGTGWLKTWDKIIPGDFGGDGKTDLLFYDRETGNYYFYTVKDNGQMQLLTHGTGWRKTWDKIIPGNFGGDGKSDLMFYDRETGDYAFYTVKDNGQMQLLTQGTGWRKTWDKIIPGNFGGNGKTDLLFYDRETGDYYFYIVTDNGQMKLLPQGTGWLKTWDEIIPGDFGGNGKTDLLFYDRETGNYYFYTVKDNGQMQLLTHGTGWRKTWDKIIPLSTLEKRSNYFKNLASWSEWQWEDSINSAADLNFIKKNSNSDIGKLYRDLSNDLFGAYFRPSGAYISDDYNNAVTSMNSYHGAIDIGGSINNREVKSLVNGTVVLSTSNYGTLTILGEDGRYYIYKHLNSRYFSEGQKVSKGQVVGKVGGVGANGAKGVFAPHLHFEVSKPPYTYGAAHYPSVLSSKSGIRDRNYNPLKAYWELKR